MGKVNNVVLIQAKYMISQINPRLLTNFLKILIKNNEYTKEEVIEKLSKKNLLNKRDPLLINELIGILNYFDILTPTNGQNFGLTKNGQKLKSVFLRSRCIFFEIFHLFQYYSFISDKNNFQLLPFESYRILSDWIYDTQSFPNAKLLADEIDNTIKKTFNVKGSFSEVCITRGIAWLKELDPPVVDENRNVQSRNSLNFKPLLLNLSLYYNLKNMMYGDPLFLDSKTILSISKASHLNQIVFEENMRNLSNEFPHLIKLKYNISGPYIVLNKKIEPIDIF